MAAIPGRAWWGLIIHPELWPTAMAVGWRLAAPGWWRRWPPRPVPTEAYRRFRMQTFLGTDDSAPLAAADLVGYLRWCRRMNGLAR